MTTGQIVGNLTSIKRRLRSINTEWEGLDNRVEARNVMQAALHEMTALHNMLPQALRTKSWVFLSLERGRAHDRSAGWK